MLEAIAPCVLVTLGAGRPIPHNNLARLRLLNWDWKKSYFFLHVKSTALVLFNVTSYV